MADSGKLLSVATNGAWLPATPPKTGAKPSEAEWARGRGILERALTEILVSENLLILAGLGASRAIRDKSGQPVAPTMQSLWDELRAADTDAFEQVLGSVNYPDDGPEDVELLLSHCQIAQLLNHEANTEEFVTKAEKHIAERCRFVSPALDLSLHEAFLRKVARRSTRHPRPRVFTTNYDLCFEQAASRSGFIVVDGFSHTEPSTFDGSYFGYDFVRREPAQDRPDFIPNVFHLYKFHGSVDWESCGEKGVVRNSAASKPLLIYPRLSKFESSFDQPFLEVMSRFQTALREPNTGLLVIGFGFNDPHVANPVMSAVRSNVSLKLVVIDPACEVSENPLMGRLRSLIRDGDPRLSLVAAPFEAVVSSMPDLSAATEDEKHRDRVRTTGGPKE